MPKTTAPTRRTRRKVNVLDRLQENDLEAVNQLAVMYNPVVHDRLPDISLMLVREKLRRDARRAAKKAERAGDPADRVRCLRPVRVFCRFDAYLAASRPPLAGRRVRKADLKNPELTIKPETAERTGPPPELYEGGFRGRVLGVPEWVRVAVRTTVDANRNDSARGGAAGNLILVLSQLAYWLQPVDKSGTPRASKKRLAKEGDLWWIVFSPTSFGKQVGLDPDHVRTAVDRLVRFGLAERLMMKGKYGPDTPHLRVAWQAVWPLVRESMTPQPIRSRPKAA